MKIFSIDVVNRQQALQDGDSTYISETLCKYCGGKEKYVSSRGCKFCSLEKLKNEELMTPYITKEKQRSRLNNWRKNNPDKVKEQHARTKPVRRQHYQKNKDQYRNRLLYNNYGISLEEYNHKLEEQKFCCAICGVNEIEITRKLAVDHCHTTNFIRGLLCGNCNTGIGLLKNEKNLVLAIEYLRRFI